MMTPEEQLRQVFAPLADRVRDEIARHVDAAVVEAAALARDRAESGAPRPQADRSDAKGLERVLDAVRALDRSRSLTEVLDTLIGCAGREAGRAGIFLVRGGQVCGWRFIGFDPSTADAAVAPMDLAEARVIGDAIRGGGVVFGDGPARLTPSGEGPAAAVPLALAGQTVAALYADAVTNRAGLEIIARHAARCLEALVAINAARAIAGS
jgi:hypothetical protein